MNKEQSGFMELVVITVIAMVVIFGGSVYLYINTHLDSISPDVGCTQEAKLCPDGSYVTRREPNCEFAACPGTTASPRPSVVNDGVVTVAQLIKDKETYAGLKVKVRGKIIVSPSHSLMPCPGEGSCDTIVDVELYFSDLSFTTGLDLSRAVHIYKDGKPYPCLHPDGIPSCPGFIDGEVRVINATFVRTQIPYQTVSNSSGVLTVVKWKDFYYLNLD